MAKIHPNAILEFIPEEGIDATSLKEKLSYLYVDVVTPREIETSMQAALESGDIVLGSKLRLFAKTAQDPYKQIANEVRIIKDKIETLQDELKAVQDKCDHKGNLTYKLWGSSGNYDPSADYYGMDWRCEDCGKTWHTSQDNIWELTKVTYPNAKRRDK